MLALVLILVLVAGSIPVSAEVTKKVSNQKDLEAAFKDAKCTKIKISTKEAVSLKIPEGKRNDVTLYVSAAKALIENNAKFKKVVIYSASTFTEKASGNTIKVSGSAGIVADTGSTIKTLALAKKGAIDKVEVKGTVSTLKISSKTTLALTLSGKLKSLDIRNLSTVNISGTAAANKVIVRTAGEGSIIDSSVPIKATLYGSADITVNEGAEGSSVILKNDGLDVSFVNESKESASFTEYGKDKVSVSAGGSKTVGKAEAEATPAPTPEATPTPAASGEATASSGTATPEPTKAAEGGKLTAVQKTVDTFTLTGGSVKEGLKEEDIKLSYIQDGVEITSTSNVKKIDYADGIATVTMFIGFDGGKTYNVKVGDEVASFVAVGNTLADVIGFELVTDQAVINDETPLKFRFYGQNGVDITDAISYTLFTSEDSNPGSIYVARNTANDTLCYIGGSGIYFYQEGTVQLSFTLVKALDSTYKPVTLTATGVVRGKAPQLSLYASTITKDDPEDLVYFTKAEKNKAKNVIYVNDTENVSFEAIVALSDGTFKTLPELGYTVETTDGNKILITGTTPSGGARLSAINPGRCVLMIKDEQGKNKFPVEIEVRAERKAQSITVETLNNKNTLNTSAVDGAVDQIIFKATVKDQYGDTIPNPTLYITQNQASITSVGTVNFGAFEKGKLVVKNTDVTITTTNSNQQVISATVTAGTENNAPSAAINFRVKNVPFSDTENYNKQVVNEGSLMLDRTVQLGDQEDDETFIYVAYMKDGFYVKEYAGRLFETTPTNTLTASALGVDPGTKVLGYTIRYVTGNTNGFYTASTVPTANIGLGEYNISFRAVGEGSQLAKGSYTVDFWEVTANASNSVPVRIGTKQITVTESSPFEAKMIAQMATASGSWADILPNFFEFTWNGEKIPASAITGADVITSGTGSGQTYIKTVTFTFDNSVYGSYTTTQNVNQSITIK